MNHRQSLIVHPIELTAEELGTLAILATRHVLRGRSSYISTLPRLLEKLFPVLTKMDCSGIEVEIFCALNRAADSFSMDDQVAWEKLRKLFAGK